MKTLFAAAILAVAAPVFAAEPAPDPAADKKDAAKPADAKK
jgi:hypothetical protein